MQVREAVRITAEVARSDLSDAVATDGEFCPSLHLWRGDLAVARVDLVRSTDIELVALGAAGVHSADLMCVAFDAYLSDVTDRHSGTSWHRDGPDDDLEAVPGVTTDPVGDAILVTGYSRGDTVGFEVLPYQRVGARVRWRPDFVPKGIDGLGGVLDQTMRRAMTEPVAADGLARRDVRLVTERDWARYDCVAAGKLERWHRNAVKVTLLAEAGSERARFIEHRHEWRECPRK